MITRTLISGGGFVNKGAEAMLFVVATALRQVNPEVEMHASVWPHDAKTARHYGFIPHVRRVPHNAFAALWSKAQRLLEPRRFPLAIDIGGYQFGDPWKLVSMRRTARNTVFRSLMGGRTAFLPQAWGPFSQPPVAALVRRVICHADLCYVRDDTSWQYVRELFEQTPDHLRLAQDIAWNFVGATAGRGEEWVARCAFPPDCHGPLYVVTPNLRVYERANGKGTQNEYLRCLQMIVEHLCRRHQARVLLLGHELYPGERETGDDRRLCRWLQEMLDPTLAVRHLDEVLTAADIKAVLGLCHLVFSSRYHALIAALSQGIVSATIGWSHKYEELMQQVGLPDNLLRWKDPPEALRAGVDGLLRRRLEMQQVLLHRLPAIRASGQQALDNVVALLEDRLG